MAATLRLTNAGRAAVIDQANVGVRAVQLTRLALGAGSGPGGAGDDGRVALRDRRDIQPVAGAPAVAGRIAVRATFQSATSYPATEVGLFARIGDAGAEFLFAYWTAGGEVFANKPADLRFVVAAVIAVVQSDAAINVTVDPAVTLGAVSSFDDLSDTPGSKVNAARRKVAVSADGRSLEYFAGLLPGEAASVQETRVGALTTRAVVPAGLAAVIGDLRGGVAAGRDTLKKLSDAVDAAITTIRGGASASRNTLKKVSDAVDAVPAPVVGYESQAGVRIATTNTDVDLLVDYTRFKFATFLCSNLGDFASTTILISSALGAAGRVEVAPDIIIPSGVRAALRTARVTNTRWRLRQAQGTNMHLHAILFST